MEFLVTLLVFSSLYAVSAYTLKRKYSHQLLDEQNKSSSLALSESQLKQKNQLLSDELNDAAKKIESLSLELSQHAAAEHEARTILDTLSKQLSDETSHRATTEEQLTKAQLMINSASAQLRSTVEERMRELQMLQQQLHDESAARKRLEEIESIKEAELQKSDMQLRKTEELLQRAKESLNATSAELHTKIEQHETTIQQKQREIDSLQQRESSAQQTIVQLNAAKLTLENEIASLTSQLQNEHASRKNVETDKTTIEQTLNAKVNELEAQLSSTTELLKKTSDALDEETNIRRATEHALQESKERLYSVIHTLEATVAERDTSISSLQHSLQHATTHVEKLSRAVQNITLHAPLPIFIVNEEGRCSFTNHALYTAVGYTSEDIVGRHFSRLFPEQERSFYEEQWKHTADRAEEFKGETHIATAAGDTLSAEINFIEIDSETEKLFVGCIVDKTDTIEAEKHYAEAKQRTEELKQLKSRFISMVTNQLRTALVTVATNTELLERFLFKWSDEKRYRAFFRINESLKQMMDLLRDVESATSSTTGYSPSIHAINLEAVAQSVAKEAANDLETKHPFILSEQGNISSVPADERIVRTILHQILSNAFKFSSEQKEVKLHIERKDSECVFKIEDQGIGIPSNEQQHLFTSFFRGSNVGNVHGTGLGLTITQQYVQLAGGTISLDSELNKGTTVTVTLPITQS